MDDRGFLVGIAFGGGVELPGNCANQPPVGSVERAVAGDALTAGGTVIQTGGGGYIIRSLPLTPQQQALVEDNLTKRVGAMTVQQVIEVGGTIARETIEFALLALVLASAAILFLLAIRFRNVPGGWRAGFQFGGSALAALLHDVFLLTGLFSIMGKRPV